MQPVGNYNKIQWFVYPSYSQECVLTFYFDLAGMRVLKNGSADEGQCPVMCGVLFQNGNSGDRVIPGHITLYYHLPDTDTGFNCCPAL